MQGKQYLAFSNRSFLRTFSFRRGVTYKVYSFIINLILQRCAHASSSVRFLQDGFISNEFFEKLKNGLKCIFFPKRESKFMHQRVPVAGLRNWIICIK